MFSNETIRKLREIHMGVMAEQLSAQLEDPQLRNVPFEDRLAMLVDAEWSARKSNRLTGLIKKAGYADTQASVENIEYIAERHLDREQILRLASCSYIQEARNVIILGATGAGKTFLACSLGVAANRNFYAARYLRLPDLLVEIAVARRDGTYREYICTAFRCLRRIWDRPAWVVPKASLRRVSYFPTANMFDFNEQTKQPILNFLSRIADPISSLTAVPTRLTNF